MLQAYKQKLYGPKYVWFIIGWYADNWYTQPDTNCTVEQMQEVLAGHFTTEGVMLNREHHASISGMVSVGSRLGRHQVVCFKEILCKIYCRCLLPLLFVGI